MRCSGTAVYLVAVYRIAVCLLLLSHAAGEVSASNETDAIRESSAAFAAAFDKGDAKAIADMWTADGELIDAAGKVHRGRPAIEAVYAEFFKLHPNEKIDVAVDSIRLLSDDAAIEEGRASLAGAKTGAANYSAIHVKQDGKWRMASVRESSEPGSLSAANLQDLDWLVGKWSGEEHGAQATVECRWLPNKHFLERKYRVTAPDGTKSVGVQLIGLNPRTGEIVSWGFASDGGNTVATWLPRPDGWAIDAAGLRPDGAETHAVNLLTKLDDNAYSWQSVRRSAAGHPQPNTDEVIIKRVTKTKSAPKPAK